MPISIGGVPDGCHRRDGSLCQPDTAECVCDRWTITKDGLAALAGYLAGVQAWIRSANGCLQPTFAVGKVMKLCGRHCQ